MEKKFLLIALSIVSMVSSAAMADDVLSTAKQGLKRAIVDTIPLVSKKNFDYGSDQEQKAIVYKPPKPANVETIDHYRSPAVILIHGGGWSPGATKEHMEDYAQHLAKAGFTVINIDYRLARKGDSHTFWPAQLQDVQLAARWVKANHKMLGIDPKRLCAVGGSAGGHLAMELGYQKSIQQGDRSEFFKEQSPDVNCVVNICGPANLEHPQFVNRVHNDTYLLGKKTPREAPAYWKSASPIHNINSDSAPTLLIQNTGDDLVTPEMGDELMKKLKENRVPSERYNVPGGHVFIGTSTAEKQLALAKMVEFIREHIDPAGAGAGHASKPREKISR